MKNDTCRYWSRLFKHSIKWALIMVAGSTLFAQPTMHIAASSKSAIQLFAQEELKNFLGKRFVFKEAPSAKYNIFFNTDSALAMGTFKVDCKVIGKQIQVQLTGSNDAAMLNAVYTFLEKMGFRFEITGPVAPTKLNLAILKTYHELIVPVVKRRGIRQHINFPMDVSSYPIEEAKEYVRNLARLRFNYIVFHSYPTQWFPIEKKGKTVPAGSFFYGQEHNIPQEKDFAKFIRNKDIYCIPAIEPFYHQPEIRGNMAVNWLQELMKECNKAGLTIRYSFESRNQTTDITATIKTTKWILEQYPLINELELITQETGNYGDPRPVSEVNQLMVDHFGKDVLNDDIVMSSIHSGKTGAIELFAEIGHNIKAFKVIEKELLAPKGIKGSLGLYVVIPEYLKSAYQLLRNYAPTESYAVLAAHGSRRVNLFLPETRMTKREWQRTMLYSWLEFDGIMFLQQNSIRGIRRLIEYGEDVNGADGISGICFNHWRTAENRTVARYAALATLYGSQDETVFYTNYAQDMGIADSKTYAAAMKKIDDADWFATTELPNIGFCYAGVWGNKGFGYFGNMNRANIITGIQLYQQALDLLQQCTASLKSKAGNDYAAFLKNRLFATVTYIKAFQTGTEMQAFNADKLLPEQRKSIADICNRSIVQFGKYMEIHSQLMPDRGCEGTLISVYHTPIAVLKRIRKELGDIPTDNEPVVDKSMDSPPAPIKFH